SSRTTVSPPMPESNTPRGRSRSRDDFTTRSLNRGPRSSPLARRKRRFEPEVAAERGQRAALHGERGDGEGRQLQAQRAHEAREQQVLRGRSAVEAAYELGREVDRE